MKYIRKLLILLLISFNSSTIYAQWQLTFPDTSEITSLNAYDSTIFAGTIGGVFISHDFGNNWIYSFTQPNIYTFNSVATNGSTIFAAINNGLRISTNNGNSWSMVSALINFRVWSVLVNGSDIFTASYLGIHLSTNGGAQWSMINNGLPVEDATAIIANGTNLFSVVDSTVYLSINNGGQWSLSNTGLINPVYSIATFGTDILAGTSDGVYISANNGGLWTPANSGLPGTPVYSLAVSGNNIFAATDSGVYLSGNNGAQWTSINPGLPSGKVKSLVICGSNIFASLSGNGHIQELWRRPLSEVVSIPEVNDENLLRIYPNPTTAKFKIEIDDLKFSNLEIYNSLGEKVLLSTNSEDQMVNEIDLSGYSKGIYILKISNGEKIIVRKLILQ